MQKTRSPVIIAAALMLVLVGGYFLCDALTARQPAVDGAAQTEAVTPIPYAEGAGFTVDALPDFAYTGSNGAAARLYDHLGTPIVLHFWNGGDEAVLEELRALESAYGQYGEDVLFLTVHTRAAAQTAQEARALFAREQLRLPLSFDEDGSALALCGAAQAPATYFIDEEGFIAARSEGGIGEDALLFGLSLLSAGAARTPGADATAAPQAQP